MSRTIDTSISIAAPIDDVWAVLVDFGAYPEWNPFLVAVEGEPAVGSRLRVRFVGVDGRSFTFRPRVQVVEPPHRLEWKGRALVPGVYDGHHRFSLHEEGETACLFRQTERFSGVMVPAVWRFTAGETRAGFDAMNEALRRRVES